MKHTADCTARLTLLRWRPANSHWNPVSDSHFYGVNTSVPDLLKRIETLQPTVLGLSLSLPSNLASLIRTLDAVSSHCPELPIVVGGQAFRWIGMEAMQAYPNTTSIASLDELAQKLAHLEV